MFSMQIVDSDAFLDMPLSAQCLYFHLNMRADDDGFVSNPKRIAKLISAADDDLKILMAKNFVLTFDTGVMVIKHWRMHNTLSSGRYKETPYTEEKALLLLKENGAYSFHEGYPIDDSHQVELGMRLSAKQIESRRRKSDEQVTNTDKIRLDKNSIDKSSRKPLKTLEDDKPGIPDDDEIVEFFAKRNMIEYAQEFRNMMKRYDWKDQYGQPFQSWKAVAAKFIDKQKNIKNATERDDVEEIWQAWQSGQENS